MVFGSEDIVYGTHPVREAIAARGREIREIWVSKGSRGRALGQLVAEAKTFGIKVRWRDRRHLDSRAKTSRHQGVVAFLASHPYASLETILESVPETEPALVLALDSIQDPQNLGALIRAAHICGVHGVVTTKDRAAPLSSAVARASAGALEHVLVARVTNLKRSLEACKSNGIWVVGLDVEGDRPLFEIDFCLPTAVVIGGESGGIRPLVKRTCDQLAAIPQRGRVQSLNAAAAGAMALYEAMRQRFMAATRK